MRIDEVKKSLNRKVTFRGGEYILTGCIIRKNQKTQQFFYQAELLDAVTNNSIIIADLKEVFPI